MVKKDEAMRDWRNLEEGLNPLEHMTPIPYKAEGSRYGACGIRIDGNPQFVDAVLSNLKHVLDGENQVTRLELARSTVKPTNINGTEKNFRNSDTGAEVCYIRLHVRGHEGIMVQSLMGHHKDATKRYAKQTRNRKDIDKMYTCYVSTVGNPDHGQYAPVSDPEWIEAETLQDLRAKVQEYKDEWDVGGGNWKNPIVYEVHGKAKKRIGSLSYNLRLWIKAGAVVGDKFIEGVEYVE